MEVVVEDDVFFADISKQISLLIMDDDDNHHQSLHPPPVSNFQAFSRGTRPSNAQIPAFYEQTSTRRRESKGTGVFIPHKYLANPRRRINNKQARFSSSTKLQQGHSSNYTTLPPRHYSYTANTFYNSINPNLCQN
ncbi:hypothetical protein LguiA_030826 [Lonicera macranthoides]